MGVAEELARKKIPMDESNQSPNSIILTSESREIIESRNEYETSVSFPFRFVVNENDAFQGTGYPKEYLRSESSLDDIMLSTMISLKMQLYTIATAGNCCSNFHKLMETFQGRGCGVRNQEFTCLQDFENPEFRICCKWTNTRFCREKWAAANKK